MCVFVCACMKTTVCMFLQMTGTNVHVTNVCPGPVRTAVSENALLADGSRHGASDVYVANGLPVKR